MNGQMSDFFTRETANEGKKIPLYKPDGSESDHWLMVGSCDSDLFRAAELEAKRQAMIAAQLEKAEDRAQAAISAQRILVATLIIGWSFEQKCTPKNVIAFLKEAPQIEELVNTIGGKRSLFYKQAFGVSISGQNTK